MGDLTLRVMPSCFGVIKNCQFILGNNIYFSGVIMLACSEENNRIVIGDRCLLATCDMVTSDFHAVYSLEDGKRCNYSGDIIIGDDVWIAHRTHLLKNTQIGRGSVIGAQALVTRKFCERNVVIAGTPAKIVKRNITWIQKPGLDKIEIQNT